MTQILDVRAECGFGSNLNPIRAFNYKELRKIADEIRHSAWDYTTRLSRHVTADEATAIVQKLYAAAGLVDRAAQEQL